MSDDNVQGAGAAPDDLAADTTEQTSQLELEREKHRKRAQKFGTKYVDPSNRKEFRLEARKEKFMREGFATGIDLFTQEEQQKLQERAQRFGVDSGGLQYVPPAPDEDEEKKKARAQRFGVEYQPADGTGLMDVDLLEQRQDVDPEAPRRPEAVHMYGVDLMSTADCLRYFADYGPTFVEWINDSCCNVLFREAATAKRAVVGLGRPLPPDEMPDCQGLDPMDPSNIELLWYKGEDFDKAGTAIPLIFRIATVRDVKPRPGEAEGQHISRGLWKAGGQQQRGRGRRSRGGRGGGRGRGGRHRERNGQQWGDGGGQEWGEEAMDQRRPPRTGGPRGGRRQKRRRDGDVEMADAEEGGEMQQRQRLDFIGHGSRRMFAAAVGMGKATATTATAPEREQIDYGDL